MILYPVDMVPPVWLLVLLCTAYDSLIQVNTSEKNLAPITRLSYIVFFTYTTPLFRFFLSSSLILDTWVLRKDTKSPRYNNLAVTKWKILLLYLSSFSYSSFTVKILCCSGEDTLPLISYPDVSINSSSFSFMSISIFLLFFISMFIPRN